MRSYLPSVPSAHRTQLFLSDHLPDSVSISLPFSLLCKAAMLNGPLLPVPSFPAHRRCKILFKMAKVKQ